MYHRSRTRRKSDQAQPPQTQALAIASIILSILLLAVPVALAFEGYEGEEVIIDDVVEDDETFAVELTDPSGGATIANHRGHALIVDPYDAAPRVVSVTVNAGIVDPPDLHAGPQPGGWATQRSEIRNIVVRFDKPMASVGSADVALINLGSDTPVDPAKEVCRQPAVLHECGPRMCEGRESGKRRFQLVADAPHQEVLLGIQTLQFRVR